MSISFAWSALRRHSPMRLLAGLLSCLVSAFQLTFTTPGRQRAGAGYARLLGSALAGVLGTLGLAWKAIRRHSLSVSATALLVTISAGLLGVSVPLALLVWALASLVSLGALRTLEPLILRRLGCRPPTHLERERITPALDAALGRALDPTLDAASGSALGSALGSPLGSALGSSRIKILVVDAAEPWLGRGVRSLVLSRALLDLLEDRALAGLLSQASEQVRAASLPGELVVWLGNVPLVGVWCVSRGLMQFGRLLAITVGASLVVPLALWPVGFTRWVGRLFGVAIVVLVGSALLSSGVSAAGLGLLLAWALVPALQTLLNWETRRAENAADDATLEAGLGWELLEALETLAWADSPPAPAAPLGWLCRLAAPLTARADRLWQALSQP